MIVHNARVGFATNSSSSHSIILLKRGGRVSDGDTQGQSFGWQYFTCATKESKLAYLALQVYQQLRGEFGEDGAFFLAQAFTGGRLLAEDGRDTPSGHVDHQSQWGGMPHNWHGPGLDREFLNDLRDWLCQDNVAILGGNDNDGDDHPDKGEGASIDFVWDSYRARNTRARKDPVNNVWTVFNPEDGTKFRFSFADPSVHVNIDKAFAPELVDLKITDYCAANCNFCYQGSTTAGAHADVKTLRSIIRALGELRVFEVALGGGEPTTHPNFTSILEDCRNAGMVPNFTTKQLEWLHIPRLAEAVKEHVGAFAFSVENSLDIDKLVLALSAARMPHNKVAIQVVMGVTDLFSLEHVLQKAYAHEIPVTLLGYKKVGRGLKHPLRGSYQGWLKRVMDLREKGVAPQVGIDTALAAESVEALTSVALTKRVYSVEEGKFSMYVDAVKCVVGPSSYQPSLLEPISIHEYARNNEELRKAFAKW